MADLTVKGQTISPVQEANAQTLLSIGQGLNAPTAALQACIFDAIFESGLGTDNGWNSGGYGGILGGSDTYFGQYGAPGSVDVTNEEARSFYTGGRGYQAGGAIAASSSYSDPSLLGPQITAPFTTAFPPPYGEYVSQGGLALIRQVKAEAIAIVANQSGLSGGGVFGLGGTGTAPNSISPSLWLVGDSTNPDEDYWTTINRYCQDSQWYCFSDGETLVIADGYQIMGQGPRAVIVRTNPTVLSGDMVYDNTAFQSTHTHKTKTGAIQRRTALARVVSPTQCTIKIIDAPDNLRGGEIVYLKQWGVMADGLWLISEARRSLFEPFTELTLVQPMAPLNANTGTALGPEFVTGPQKSIAGTVIGAMIGAASEINNAQIPYEYGGGRDRIGYPDKGDPGGNHVGGYGTVGFDCSGVVAAVLNAGGLWPKTTLGSDVDIITTLRANGTIVPGQGTGRPECTLFDDPTVHIFMRLNGQIFGTSDGGGTPTSGGGSGGAWLTSGPDVSSYTPWHIPARILGQTPGVNGAGGAT